MPRLIGKIDHTCDGTDKRNCVCRRERRRYLAALRRDQARPRGEDGQLLPPLPVKIDHTCDGTDKRRCACALTRQRERVHHSRKYGLDRQGFDQLRADQGYRCAICRRHEDELSFIYRPRREEGDCSPTVKLVIDHCHDSGKVRGLLCARCNSGIGQFQDDPELIEAAARWVRGE